MQKWKELFSLWLLAEFLSVNNIFPNDNGAPLLLEVWIINPLYNALLLLQWVQTTARVWYKIEPHMAVL